MAEPSARQARPAKRSERRRRAQNPHKSRVGAERLGLHFPTIGCCIDSVAARRWRNAAVGGASALYRIDWLCTGGAGHSISWRWTPGCPWGPSRPGLSRDEHRAVGCRTRSVAARPHSTGLSRRTVAHQFARLRFPLALAASMAAPRWGRVPHLSGRGYPGTIVSNAPDGGWLCTEAPKLNARRDRRRMNSWARYAPSRSPFGGQYLERLRQARSEPSLG